MPSSPLDFRPKCGCFVVIFNNFMLKRTIQKVAMRFSSVTLRSRVDGVTFGFVLTFLFWGGLLLRAGDVEQNPGPAPPKTDSSMRQTRLTSSGRRASLDRGAASSQDSAPGHPQTPPPTSEPTLIDLMKMMQDMTSSMNGNFEDVKSDMKDLREHYDTLQSEVKGLREEVSVLRQENKDLLKTNSDLLAKIEDLDKKTDDLENRSKRNNLIFHGIERSANESSEECERKMTDLIRDKLGIREDIKFDRVHRLSQKQNSPLIARCCFYKDKTKILKEKKKLQGTNIFIGEDFSSRVREIRRKLNPHLKKARSEGKRVAMVFDHLLIEGSKFFLSDDNTLRKER